MSFREAVIQALETALGADAEALGDLGRLVAPPKQAAMGDLAFGCFLLAKTRRMAPPAIAEALAGEIEATGPIGKVVATGPFLNFFADPVALLGALANDLASGAFDQSMLTDTPKRVMIEFSQPNTHKTFHVGHLRNVVLGDALVRVFRARGHDVVPANYYGDFGVDVAKCLWQLRDTELSEAPADGRTAWLGAAYSAANDALKVLEADSEELQAEKHQRFKEVRAVLAQLEAGEPEIMGRYQATRQWCLDEFAEVYRWLDVQFDHDFFESELEAPARAIVDAFVEQGVFVESDGALICDLEAEGMIPALVRKRDGASLYMTWDLALASQKFDQFGVEQSLYVTGSEQDLHFQQLFATLGRMGYERAGDCRHVSYELVMLPEGKMSSRKGTAIPFHKLQGSVLYTIDAKMRADERTDRSAWDAAQWSETTRNVAVACLKYGMLHVGNSRSVVFKLEDWLNPEGDTGAYLLYSIARMSGIFRKTDETIDLAAPLTEGGEFGSETERDLLGHLQKLPETVRRVEESCDPSALATFVFDGAKRFSRFYQACPVLKADAATRHARLTLCKTAEVVLTKALDLLGIATVEAM